MNQISDLELYIGTKEEFNNANKEYMKIVCALNEANGYVTHQSLVNQVDNEHTVDSPDYLVYEDEDIISLNMIDDCKCVCDDMIEPALDFISSNLDKGYKVFIYCNTGECRSPSLALMHLLETGVIKKDEYCFDVFRKNYYPKYNPKNSIKDYIANRYLN